MNFIISSVHNKYYFSIINSLLKHFRVRKLHLTFTESKIKKLPGTIINYYQIKKIENADYGIKWNKIVPLDEELIEQMNDCEVIILKMMDRLPYNLSYEERHSLYLKHLRYWNHVIQTDKISTYISLGIPHEIYDYIIYYLCQLKGITTLLLYQTAISDTALIIKNWSRPIKEINKVYLKLLKKYKKKKEPILTLKGRFKRDFDQKTGNKSLMPFYMFRSKPSHNAFINFFSILLKTKINRFMFLVKNPNLLTRSIVTYVFQAVLDSRLDKYYKRNSVIPDLSKKYLYFPLHLQPELSTSPLAGPYVNQLLVVQLLAYYLPANIYIYIKENPHQTGVSRSLEFYEELIKIPQVRLVPKTFNTFKLTDNSLAVVTISGTAGLEALYREKPVLLFGHIFFEIARGVFRIRNNHDCKSALNWIINKKYTPRIKDIKFFLKALESTSIEGYVDIDYQKYSYVSSETNKNNILNKIIFEIEKSN